MAGMAATSARVSKPGSARKDPVRWTARVNGVIGANARLRKVRGGNSCESEQVADMFTKGLNRPLFQALRSRIMG